MEKIVGDTSADENGAKAGGSTLSEAVSAIAKRMAEHEKEMTRIKGDIQRGARAGKGRFRL
ncbi:hypothetical protein [Luteibacter sp. ME-Dv--P-043b]|uniref:hypothetical protein n=1 Tax=unclassified Luteibacter TaxID=2620188 RepID=UPI00255439C5|nr:hypothetical protein [Luteibacter sp. ME-Dv--P-043b]